MIKIKNSSKLILDNDHDSEIYESIISLNDPKIKRRTKHSTTHSYFNKGKNSTKSFIKDNECSGKEGKFHYPMKSYYVKLTSMKGQIDAAFRSSSEIKLNDFKCDILYKKFETIPKDSTILFEFKNGKSGEKSR